MGKNLGSKGLEASMWATNDSRPVGYTPRAGDWTCLSCRFSNFASRQACYQCFLPKEEALRSGLREGPGQSNGFMADSTTPMHTTPTLLVRANGSQASQNAHLSMPVGSSENRGGLPLLSTRPPDNGRYGLATSRWAPKNTNRLPKKADGPEIWTRTIPVSDSEPKANGYDNPVSSNQPDLGLPYEVQHFVLTMTQRIMEEGCYDFASRWMPNVLRDKHYTCSEAVELSEWRRLLPESIPSEAIDSISKDKLEGALVDAVRIRNAAVHRHLCNNAEIRKMARQAENLMSMFKDVTREAKFHHLNIELGEWDKRSGDDQQGARNRLQSALHVIGEKPMDDMDWTPNAVSLRELTPETVSQSSRGIGAKSGTTPHYFDDEMELD